MKYLIQLYEEDFPDTKYEPDGYYWKQVPEATPRNFLKLLNLVNQLVDEVNELNRKLDEKS